MKEKDGQRRKPELILTGAAFTFFLLVTCYKLLNASLWFDETIEYWYSKIMFGPLPFFSAGTEESVNMYQRIVSTYQPPLYNVVMHFWLKISDSEWWFRFFGVVMGFIGMLGIYWSVKRMCNSVTAALAVFFSSTLFRLCYYWQECAEYCLMLGTLCWTVYFWICLLQETSTKYIILFTISAIFPVYSQYGAVFPVLGMLLTALAAVILQKDKKYTVTICLAYFCAFLFAAVPLFYFFLRVQMVKQQGGGVHLKNMEFAGIFRDFWESMYLNLKWNLFPLCSDWIVRFFLVLAFVLLAIVLFIGKNRLLKWMLGFQVITYMVYFFAVKIGAYSYGHFGDRYSLFLIPPWIILAFGTGYRIYGILQEQKSIWRWSLSGMEFLFLGICICAMFCSGMHNWTSGLQANWVKDDIRGAVNAWYKEKAYEKNTLIYYAADSGFAYYVRQNKDYVEETEAKVDYMEWFRDKSVEEYTAYVNEIYGECWPDELYIVASHVRGDMNTLIEGFVLKGYEQKKIFNAGGASLTYLSIVPSADGQ